MWIEVDDWSMMFCRMTWSKVKVKVTTAWKALKKSRLSILLRTNFFISFYFAVDFLFVITADCRYMEIRWLNCNWESGSCCYIQVEVVTEKLRNFMATVHSRCGYYIFALWFLSTLGCRSENGNAGRNNNVKKLPSQHHHTSLSGCIFATKACIDNQKKRGKQ